MAHPPMSTTPLSGPDPYRGLARRVKKLTLRLLFVLLSPWTLPFAWLSRRSDSVYTACSEFLSLVPGRIGQCFRVSFYSQTLAACPWDVFISFGARIVDPRTRIGHRVNIGAFSLLGRCTIEDRTLIASWVIIEPPAERCVNIGAGSWIGEGAIVLESIGSCAVIGAGCVVTAPVDAGITATGNPLRQRGVVS